MLMVCDNGKKNILKIVTAHTLDFKGLFCENSMRNRLTMGRPCHMSYIGALTYIAMLSGIRIHVPAYYLITSHIICVHNLSMLLSTHYSQTLT